jgi:hypothetical protein
MKQQSGTPNPLKGLLGRFFILVGVLAGLLIVAYMGTVTIVDEWPWREKALSPARIGACAAEIGSPDERVRLHARDHLVRIAQECPQIADLLAPAIAGFLRSDDLRTRASTVEALGTLGPAAQPFEGAVLALRGAGVPNLDHTIDLAVAGIHRAVPHGGDGLPYCSQLSRAAVEAALQAPPPLKWSWATIDQSCCTSSPRGD